MHRHTQPAPVAGFVNPSQNMWLFLRRIAGIF